MQDRDWLAVKSDIFCVKSFGRNDPGGIHKRFPSFPDLVYKPVDFGRVFSFGAAVDDDEDQKKVPVLDGVQKLLKPLPVVSSIL